VGPVLAKGESSLLFKGKDTRDGKEVVLKVLAPEYARIDDEVQRFIRAMKTTIDLKHPNLVALYGAGKSGDTLWLAMEFVDGESLTKVIERIGTIGMLDWKYALSVAAQVARGLEAAYNKQIIHRNVKPENILVRKSDQVAKLGDLMLAKGLGEMSGAQITKPGQMVGDLIYASPERTQSESNVDTRSDIYSLGVTIYELLTGRPTVKASSILDTVLKIRTETPARPKTFQLSIPDLFEGVVMRMLEKDPDARYQTPGELVRDLERVARFNGVSL
jgi:serine/threonine-protein kinase